MARQTEPTSPHRRQPAGPRHRLCRSAPATAPGLSRPLPNRPENDNQRL